MSEHPWASGQVLGGVADWWPVLRLEALLRGRAGGPGSAGWGEAGHAACGGSWAPSTARAARASRAATGLPGPLGSRATWAEGGGVVLVPCREDGGQTGTVSAL